MKRVRLALLSWLAAQDRKAGVVAKREADAMDRMLCGASNRELVKLAAIAGVCTTARIGIIGGAALATGGTALALGAGIAGTAGATVGAAAVAYTGSCVATVEGRALVYKALKPASSPYPWDDTQGVPIPTDTPLPKTCR